ncbi:xyloglucan galactosyltransferase KATAMARI1 homolog [Hibiscus syriacus]|uniref:xyloglucan galactosyltransferase KATAMARI1 homolog n=1 Tax=Hibiscus syriacus TaxID=106335 RepID=UPI0019207327|nr:xyloglucan galactosyltransferase KATAMARI1 homolog [Hibiscus syriacus]
MNKIKFCINHIISMSSETLMEKPSGKCRCRTQSWYIVFISFILWFTLYMIYLYSSSVTFSKMEYSLTLNNDTALFDSSESFLDVVRDDETEYSSRAGDINIVDDVEDGNDTEEKPVDKLSENEEIYQVIQSLVEDQNETEPVETETNSGNENRDVASDKEVKNKDEDDKTVKDKGKENHVTEQKKGTENVAKQKKTANVSERQKEDNPEEQPVVTLPIVKSQIERTRHSRRETRNKPVDSSDPVKEKRIEKAVVVPRRARARLDPCSGRYIYIHNLPRKFNQDLLETCRSLSFWTDMCECASNLGLGAPLPPDDKLYSRTGWFNTNQFFLEVIFHNRMKQYRCLTKDPSVASAIYVPYYAGLDVGRYLWDPDGFMRDYDAVNVVKWLASRPEWKRMWGRDHFLVAGRINWDFRRNPKNESDWGNELLNLDEARNTTTLVLESSPWNYNDFAIPYPTYFHPSTDSEVFQWQNRMRRLKRRFLFSFAGARRPGRHESIRNELIDQCLATRRRCRFLECDKTQKCHNPAYVLKLFQSSIFCLQPSGDSYTRRSIFDSIVAGCIPVFFHPGSAYVQYIWHFPKDYRKYSVFIPERDVKSGKSNIERILQRISRERRASMRDEVISMISSVIYADPSSRLRKTEDAFDLTVKGVLDRIEKVRNQMNEGRIVNYEFDEEESWKYFVCGKLGSHEWDIYFSRKIGKHVL